MTRIRRFCNADLPALAERWVQHWSAYGPPPEISGTMIEQAVLGRTFFHPDSLLVAEYDGYVHGWCHLVERPKSDAVIMAALCASPEGGRGVLEPLIEAAERQVQAWNYHHLLVGPLRDNVCGYVGLDPVGHGIGVPTTDHRTSSLLAHLGYLESHHVERMRAETTPYRPPINRESLQLARTTRLETEIWLPSEPRLAAAMSHLDIERHRLVDHRGGEVLAEVRLWTSDPEAQVMRPSEAILDLSESPQGDLDTATAFLIGSLLRTLANRRIFHVETAVDQADATRMAQLKGLHFRTADTGIRWQKPLA